MVGWSYWQSLKRIVRELLLLRLGIHLSILFWADQPVRLHVLALAENDLWIPGEPAWEPTCGLSHRSQALLLHHHWFMEDRESWSLSLGLHWSRCHCSKESLCSGIGSTSFQRASENLFEQFIPAGAVPAMDSLLSNSLCVVWPFSPPGSRVSQACTKNSINVGADWVAFLR